MNTLRNVLNHRSIVNIDRCCGCGACVSCCPRNAVFIVQDEEGFFKSSLNAEMCVECGICLDVCPEYEDVYVSGDTDFEQEYFAARNRTPEVVRNSSSGGVFYGLSKRVIYENGVVYGVKTAYNNEIIEAIYSRAQSLDEIRSMMGSKYVQAKMTKEVISDLINDTEKGRKVLFSGTSCVISGLKKLMKNKGIDDEKVCWVDFLCSGAVSPLITQMEIKRKSELWGEKISDIQYRNKISGWRNYSIKYTSEKKERYEFFFGSILGALLGLDHAMMRKCSDCSYRSYERVSDITMGDFWNEEYLPRKWQDDKGTSMIMINSNKGSALLNRADGIEYHEVTRREIDSPRLHRDDSITINMNERTEFWNVFRSDYQKFIKIYCSMSLLDKIILTFIRPFMIKTGILRRINSLRRLKSN